MVEKKTIQKAALYSILIFAIVAVFFYYAGGEQFKSRDVSTDDPVVATGGLPEITAGHIVKQPFTLDADNISQVKLTMATYDRVNTGVLIVSIRHGESILGSATVQLESIQDNTDLTVVFERPINITPGEDLELCLESDGETGNAVTAYYGSEISLAKGSVEKPLSKEDLAQFDETPIDGILCFQVSGRESLVFGQFYWYGVAALFVLLVLYWLVVIKRLNRGKTSMSVLFIIAMKKYKFLIKQLVSRDFKAKYKRSVLGVMWSFLNPILMMTVQYIVFSTLFKSSIPNFSAYLFIGIVCFNFFSEATSMSLQSISGNAALITKVYIPKYIYPVSRVISSCINLLLSLIPLLGVLLITGNHISLRSLLTVFGLVCLVALALGIGMILASMMVFFRDTQFLWGVIITIWNFATPIFYPESIIPAQYMTVYKMNPLYHIVRFMRIVLMDGVSPDPKAYLFCILASFIPLALGILIFKKCQDRFALYV